MQKEQAWRDSTAFVEGKMDEVASVAVEDRRTEGLIGSIKNRDVPILVFLVAVDVKPVV